MGDFSSMKLIIKIIGFIGLGIAFISLYIPIVIISQVIQAFKDTITPKKPHDPPFSLNPFSEDYQQTRKKEEDSRKWLVKPLKQFFTKSFNQLKNW
jgi:hypothetical protein